MKVAITVASHREAQALKTALDDPEIRTFVLISGTLLPFSPIARERILSFVTNIIDEREEA